MRIESSLIVNAENIHLKRTHNFLRLGMWSCFFAAFIMSVLLAIDAPLSGTLSEKIKLLPDQWLSVFAWLVGPVWVLFGTFYILSEKKAESSIDLMQKRSK